VEDIHSPDSAAWINVLNLNLLSVSNGVVERVFSQMNVFKGNRRSLLANDNLDDLLRISAANMPLHDSNAIEVNGLWLPNKIRCLN